MNKFFRRADAKSVPHDRRDRRAWSKRIETVLLLLLVVAAGGVLYLLLRTLCCAR
jgi:hypothetical protein